MEFIPACQANHVFYNLARFVDAATRFTSEIISGTRWTFSTAPTHPIINSLLTQDVRILSRYKV